MNLPLASSSSRYGRAGAAKVNIKNERIKAKGGTFGKGRPLYTCVPHRTRVPLVHVPVSAMTGPNPRS